MKILGFYSKSLLNKCLLRQKYRALKLRFLVAINYLLVETVTKCLSSIGFGKSVVLIKQSCDLILNLF